MSKSGIKKQARGVIVKVLKYLMKNRCLAVCDALIIIISYLFVLFIGDKCQNILEHLPLVGITCAVYLSVFYLFMIYRRWWPYGSIKDYAILFAAWLVSAGLIVGLEFFVNIDNLRLREVICVNIIVLFCTFFLRALVRVMDRYIKYLDHYKVKNGTGIRTLVYGAGAGAMLFLRELEIAKDYTCSIVGLVDDDPRKKHLVFFGYKVLGTGEDLMTICDKYDVDDIVIAMPAADSATKKRIAGICSDTGRNVKIVPGLDEMVNGKQITSLRRINIEDLLAREPVQLDNEGLSGLIRNRCVAVTGGGGSIGSELCRQIARYRPECLIIIDIYENNAYDLQNELKSAYPNLNLEVLIASVRDKARIDKIFEEYRPSIVFHAAAHKHVPLMEDSPAEAVKNNVFGTYNVARSAMEHNVERFVMISTDKAVNPTNVMGATKRMCEMIVQGASTCGRVKYSATRFGNVLGSAGSVIPLFKKQIMNGGPITLTDKRIIRYFMTIPEAAQLVLESGTMAKNGELFVLDMGQPVKILDLAENMIRLLGVSGIEIVETGLRPGEKLYEELLVNTKDLDKTDNSLIFIEKEQPISRKEVEYKLNLLRKACESDNDDLVREALREAVPTYKTPEEVNSNAEDSEEMKNQHIEVKV